MFNGDLETNTNTTNSQENDENNFGKKIKNAMIMTVILAVARILGLEIMMLISDLLSALMLYFFLTSRNKCMAIMTGINGGMGVIYAFIKFFPAWTLASKNWFSIYHSLLLCISVYALVVYSFVLYLAYKGYIRYEATGFGFGPSQGQSQGQNNYTVSSNYGAIDNKANSNFKAFTGKGVTMG
jgi:hypothetical protein